ncbi:MAG: sterol desaturase family protein [Saprospiraceae bacterium]|nr:sterol desaturase family protein [Saprospiraceae bacterium]
MQKYIDIIINSYGGYFYYLIDEIMHLRWGNYFYALIFISLFVFSLELIFPWRKTQPIFRDGFWLDVFYMFFNFFLLNLIILIALSNVASQLFESFLGLFGMSLISIQLFDINKIIFPLGLVIFFLITDFIQWLTHILLHRSPFLWQFHKVHHSVIQMGFAAHLRYHWVEPVVYKSILYIPVALIGGFQVEHIFWVHLFSILIGHLNHANVSLDYGLFKYILNNPKMHIWHHAKKLPNHYGVNFGISLSIWDYLFRTNYLPYSGRDIPLGFEGDEHFPTDFIGQELLPLKK